MAVLFDDGNAEYLERDAAPVAAAPFSVACWFRTDDITIDSTLLFIGDKDLASQNWQLLLSGAVGGNPANPRLDFTAFSGGGATAQTSSPYLANTLHHACAVEAAADDRAVYLDGGAKGTDTTSVTPSNADRVSIGRAGDSTPTRYLSGDVGEVSIWDIALTDAEVASLATGIPAWMIRPESLVAYWPLYDINIFEDLVGGFDVTSLSIPSDLGVHPPITNSRAVQGAYAVLGAPAPPGGKGGRMPLLGVA